MANDLWRTPKPVFEYYNSRYDFVYDVAASDENHLCEKYITEDDNFLTEDLNGYDIESGSYVWCNPPYSNPLPFVRKCITESINNGIGTVMLLNHDMSVEWSSLLATIGCRIEVLIASGSKQDKTYCDGRIAFIDGDGNPISSNNKGQFTAIIPPFVDVHRDADTSYVPLSRVMECGQRMIDESTPRELPKQTENYNLAA